jgi:hypothetical protein
MRKITAQQGMLFGDEFQNYLKAFSVANNTSYLIVGF